MAKYTVEAPDGRRVTLEGDSEPTESDLNDIFSSLPESNSEQVGQSDQPSVLDRFKSDLELSSPVGAMANIGFDPGMFIGKHVNQIPASALRSLIQGTGYTQGAMNPESVPSFADVFSEGSGESPVGLVGPGLAPRQTAGLIADFATSPFDLLTAVLGASKTQQALKSLSEIKMGGIPKNLGPSLPHSAEVESAIDTVKTKFNKLSSFYKNTNDIGNSVIDESAKTAVIPIENRIIEKQNNLKNTAYAVAKKFRDEYFPRFNKNLTEDFGKAWGEVVNNVEIERSDIMDATSKFAQDSGLYNKAQYSPETLQPVERKILDYIGGLRDRLNSGSVSRMRLSDLSDGFESILRGEYGKQWKTPILDDFRKSFIDLAGDAKYSEMKDVKAKFKPLYRFREDMRPLFGSKKGDILPESAVKLFENYALDKSSASKNALLKKITSEFGDNSIDAITKLSSELSDLSNSKNSVLSNAEIDKTSFNSRVLAKVANATSDKEQSSKMLSDLLSHIEKRNEKNAVTKVATYLSEKFVPLFKEANTIRKISS